MSCPRLHSQMPSLSESEKYKYNTRMILQHAFSYSTLDWLIQNRTRCSRRRQTSPLVPPPGELDENICAIFDSGPFTHVCENMISTKPEGPQVLCTENWLNLDIWFLRWASGQTNIDIHA